MQEIKTNEVLNAVSALLIKQTEKGVQKYGQAVTPANLTTIAWLEHAQEEIVDLLVYLECLKQKLLKDSDK
jgi:hypothetical protein